MPLNYLSSSNAKDRDVLNVSKDLAELWFIVKELIELHNVLNVSKDLVELGSLSRSRSGCISL